MLAVVVSVDVTPEARQLAESEGWNGVWITNIYHTCPRGANLAFVRGDPKPTEGEWIDVDAGNELTVHVPANKYYKNDIPRVIVRQFAYDHHDHMWGDNETDSPDENLNCE